VLGDGGGLIDCAGLWLAKLFVGHHDPGMIGVLGRIVCDVLALRTRLLLVVLTLAAALAVGFAASMWALSVQARGVDAGYSAYSRLQWAQNVAVHVDAATRATAVGQTDQRRRAVNLAILAAESRTAKIKGDPQVVSELRSVSGMLAEAMRPGAETDENESQIEDLLRTVAQRVEGIANAADGELLKQQRAWPNAKGAAVRGLIAVLVVTLVVVALATWSQFVSIRSSFRKLNARVQRIASGRINERLPDASGDKELAELSKNINLVAERLHGLVISLEERVRGQSTALARAERLASVGFLAAGVAHEINNPLAVITGEAELLNTDGLPPEAVEAVAVIRDEAFRCKKITKRLLKLSTPGGAEAEAVDCRTVAAGILRNARNLAKERGVKLVCQVPKGLTIYADRIEIKQVLLNLVVNATEAEATTVRVVGVLDTERIGMAVLDDGRGLEPEQLLRVFEPFYTTKTGTQGTGGTGLGLALAYAIIEQSGGLLEAFSDGPFKGCQFVMSWPKETQPVPEASEALAASGAGEAAPVASEKAAAEKGGRKPSAKSTPPVDKGEMA